MTLIKRVATVGLRSLSLQQQQPRVASTTTTAVRTYASASNKAKLDAMKAARTKTASFKRATKGGSSGYGAGNAEPGSKPIDIPSEYMARPPAHNLPVFAAAAGAEIGEGAGQIMALAPELVSALQPAAKLLPPSVQQYFSATHSSGLLVRGQSVELAKLATQAPEAKDSRRAILLDGLQGIGKSALLLQTVAAAMSVPGSVILYAPQTTRWFDGTTPYERVQDASNATVYHTPSAAATMLRTCLSLSDQDALAETKLSKDVTLAPGKIVKAQSVSLLDFVKHGAETPADAHNVLDGLLAELSLPESKLSTLIAIDEVDALFASKLEIFDAESNPIAASQTRMHQTLAPFVLGDRSLGSSDKPSLVVSAGSRRNMRFFTNELYTYASSNVAEKKMRVIEVPRLNARETKTLIDFYVQSQIEYGEVTDQFVMKRHLIAAGVPQKLHKATMSYIV